MESRVWTLIIISIGLFLLTAANNAETSSGLHQAIQKLRGRIFSLQSGTANLLDKSSLKLYTTLNLALKKRVHDPYDKLKKDFKKSCENFPIYNLESFAVRRLTNICDDIKRFQKRLERASSSVVANYHPNATLIKFLADDYFKDMGRHLLYLNTSLGVTHQNPACAVNLLESFLKIYKVPVDKLMMERNKTIKLIHRTFRGNFKVVIKAFERLYGVTNKMKKCSNAKVIDTFKCVSDFVSYDCTKIQSCGSVFKAMDTILKHIKKIDIAESSFETSCDNLYKAMNEADDSLVNWSNELDKCVIFKS